VTAWPSTRARRVLAALLRIGWTVKRQSGSHCTLSRDGWLDFVFAFHDSRSSGRGCWLASQNGRGSLQVTSESRVPANKPFEPTGSFAARGSTPGR
jgi:predicted RNA binding protein YcfA (HicA-like mRNA interferase family)